MKKVLIHCLTYPFTLLIKSHALRISRGEKTLLNRSHRLSPPKNKDIHIKVGLSHSYPQLIHKLGVNNPKSDKCDV